MGQLARIYRESRDLSSSKTRTMVGLVAHRNLLLQACLGQLCTQLINEITFTAVVL